MFFSTVNETVVGVEYVFRIFMCEGFYIPGSAQHFEIYAKFCSFRNDWVFCESYYIASF